MTAQLVFDLGPGSNGAPTFVRICYGTGTARNRPIDGRDVPARRIPTPRR
jgi:hypothetical protein